MTAENPEPGPFLIAESIRQYQATHPASDPFVDQLAEHVIALELKVDFLRRFLLIPEL